MKEKAEKRIIPQKEYEFNYIESFLMDMAGKGRFFARFDGDYAVFGKGEPVDRRYRFVPKRKKHVMEEELYLIQDRGWVFDCVKGNLILIHTDDPEAEEIQATGASLRKKSQLLLYMWIVIGIAVAILTAVLFGKMPEGVYGPAALFVLVALIGYYGWSQVMETRKCAEIFDHGDINHDIPYEEKFDEAEKRYSRFWIVIGALGCFIVWLMIKAGVV